MLGTQFSVKLTPKSSLNKNCNLLLSYTVKKNEIPVDVNKSICVGNSYVHGGKTLNSDIFTNKIITETKNGEVNDFLERLLGFGKLLN